MHLQAYQISNVLNVFRKQLRQKTRSRFKDSVRSESTDTGKSGLPAAEDNQRRIIIDQISADIVKRMARSCQPGFCEDTGDGVAEAHTGYSRPQPPPLHENEFAYTLIDEHNRKQTNVLQINGTSPLLSEPKRTVHEPG